MRYTLIVSFCMKNTTRLVIFLFFFDTAKSWELPKYFQPRGALLRLREKQQTNDKRNQNIWFITQCAVRHWSSQTSQGTMTQLDRGDVLAFARSIPDDQWVEHTATCIHLLTNKFRSFFHSPGELLSFHNLLREALQDRIAGIATTSIPVLHNWSPSSASYPKAGSLVKTWGMIQDIRDPQYYPLFYYVSKISGRGGGGAAPVNKGESSSGGEALEELRTGSYTDIRLGADEVYQDAVSHHMNADERVPTTLSTVPGEGKWFRLANGSVVRTNDASEAFCNEEEKKEKPNGGWGGKRDAGERFAEAQDIEMEEMGGRTKIAHPEQERRTQERERREMSIQQKNDAIDNESGRGCSTVKPEPVCVVYMYPETCELQQEGRETAAYVKLNNVVEVVGIYYPPLEWDDDDIGLYLPSLSSLSFFSLSSSSTLRFLSINLILFRKLLCCIYCFT